MLRTPRECGSVELVARSHTDGIHGGGTPSMGAGTERMSSPPLAVGLAAPEQQLSSQVDKWQPRVAVGRGPRRRASSQPESRQLQWQHDLRRLEAEENEAEQQKATRRS